MPDSEPRWGLGDVLVGMIPFLLGALVLLSGSEDTEADDVVTVTELVGFSLFVWLFIAGVPVVATLMKGNGPITDLGLRFRPVDVGGLVVGVVLQALVVPALYWPYFELAGGRAEDVEAEARRLTDGAHGFGILVLVLVVCVGVPLAEELFYRGLVLRALDKRFAVGVAVAGSTLLFGVSHLQGLQLPALLVFGAVAALLAVRTGRLGPAILCHAGFNGWSLLQLLVIDPR